MVKSPARRSAFSKDRIGLPPSGSKWFAIGNGRMTRFLMNVMLSSGGYACVVVPVERYNITPFAEWLAGFARSAS